MSANAGPAVALRWATPASWAPAVATDPEGLLSDHAHCELKAAASAMTLIRRAASGGAALRLAGLVREEGEHLQRVLRLLHERGEVLRPDRPSPYAEGLRRAAAASRRGRPGPLDALLVSALIEARSHERMARLAECPALASLAPVYRSMLAAEARHGALFVGLARQVAPAGVVAARLDELARHEAALIAGLPCESRMHSGPPGS